MRIILFIFLAIIVLFPFTIYHPSQGTKQQELTNIDVIVNTTMQVNLVMIGDTWSEEDQNEVRKKLIKTHMPNVFYENRIAGVKYNYRYVFSNMTPEQSDELFGFMDNVARQSPMPEFVAEWMRDVHPEFGKPERRMYKIIDASAIEEWLAELHREDGYTIYFLKPSTDKVNYFHTYGTIGTDPDTGIEFVQEGMMGFDGNYRFYFIDLSAGPWIYPYWYFHQNIYDIETKDEYHEFIAKYVNNALLLLFTPSYLYNPVYQSNHEIDIFLIDMTAGRVFQDISNKFINKSVIENAFAKLIPYVDWTSEIEGHMFDSLPRELQRSILRSLTFTDVEGSEGIILVKSSDLITELNKWIVSNLPIEQLEMMEEESEKTIFIPVVLFVFDKSAYVDDAPTLGKAVPDPDDNTIPCCAIVAQDKHTLFNTGAGLSGVTSHEMGHVLGLRHPHDGHNPTEGEFIDWFFDWSYTPMTYSSPSSLGCGPSLRCGLVINEFGQFNYDALDRGMVLNLLNQTQKNIEDSKLQFLRSGDEDNLPQSVSIKLTSIQIDIEKSKEYFENMTYFNHNTFMGTKSIMDPMDDAFDFALRALLTSEELLNTSNTLSKKLEPTGIKTVSILDPHLINATGSKSGTVEVGNSIDVRSQILINIDETISFSYIVQVKDYAGATISLTWLEELFVSESIEASLLWTSDTRGEFEIEIFVWNNIVDPIPLAPIKSMHVNVT